MIYDQPHKERKESLFFCVIQFSKAHAFFEDLTYELLALLLPLSVVRFVQPSICRHQTHVDVAYRG